MYPTRSSGIDIQGIRASWDAVAEGYDEFVTDTNTPLAREALERAGVGPGTRFLDVASGSGALSIPAARAGARVTAVDLSPRMAERLQVRSARQGLSDIIVHVMDGHALEFEDASFDVTASQYGVMLFHDLPLGLSEMARVTRSAGRVLVVAFGPPPRLEFNAFFIRAVKSAVPGFTGLPADTAWPLFQLADPAFFRTRLFEAGLEEISIETVSASNEVESGAQMWQGVAHGNPIAAGIIAGLSEEQRLAAQKELDRLVQERAGENGKAVLSHTVHIGVGTVR